MKELLKRWAGAPFLVLVLLWPEIWNRGAFWYPDTVTYLYAGLHLETPPFRLATYGLLTAPFAAAQALQWVPVVQVVLVTLLVGIFVNQVRELIRPMYTWLIALVCLGLSTYPFSVDHLLPDFLAPLLVFSIALIWSFSLGRWAWAFCHFVCLLALAVHTSHLILLVGLTVAAFALRLVKNPRQLAQAFVSVLVACAAVVTFHGCMGKWTLSPGAPVFLFAQSVASGAAERFLDEHCEPKPVWRACAYRRGLTRPALLFLWGEDLPLGQIGGWNDTSELEDLNRQILREPRLVASLLWSGFVSGLRQMYTSNAYVLTPTPDILASLQLANDPTDTRQFEEPAALEIPMLASTVASWLSLAAAFGSLWFVLARRRPVPRPIVTFASVLALGFVVNAFVCGMASTVDARYQARIAWILPFSVMTAAAAALGNHRQGDHRPLVIRDPRS